MAVSRKLKKGVRSDATSRISQSTLVSIKQLIKELEDYLYRKRRCRKADRNHALFIKRLVNLVAQKISYDHAIHHIPFSLGKFRNNPVAVALIVDLREKHLRFNGKRVDVKSVTCQAGIFLDQTSNWFRKDDKLGDLSLLDTRGFPYKNTFINYNQNSGKALYSRMDATPIKTDVIRCTIATDLHISQLTYYSANAQVPSKLGYHQTFYLHIVAIIVMPLFSYSVLELITCNW